jgi:hypothetical protein
LSEQERSCAVAAAAGTNMLRRLWEVACAQACCESHI